MELDLQPLRLPADNIRPFVVAGPCSAESEEQVLTTAKSLAALGCHIFRAGVWKPRTKPGGFEGRGEEALKWLTRVKQETGMLVATEVARVEHVEACLKYGIDVLWIGARTTADPFAMQAIADALKGVDIPMLVKNPINPDLELWVGALERLSEAGVKRLGAIHRGFSTYDKRVYRNLPLWHIPLELHRRYPTLPLVCDPSHIGGQRKLIEPLCQQAMDMGFDGLIVECHCRPDEALSDAQQQVTPEVLDVILKKIKVRSLTISTEDITALRREIDLIDEELVGLVAKRMQVSREIGQYKKEHGIAVVQQQRYDEVLQRRSAEGESCGLNPEFTRHLYSLIHEESVRQQIEIVNE